VPGPDNRPTGPLSGGPPSAASSPPKALLTIEMRADFVEARFFGSCAAGDVEDAEIATCVRRERRFVYLDE